MICTAAQVQQGVSGRRKLEQYQDVWRCAGSSSCCMHGSCWGWLAIASSCHSLSWVQKSHVAAATATCRVDAAVACA
jgi:hypothetical protein